MTEFWCHLCRDWYESNQCQSHFDSAHGRKDFTFENLKKHMSVLGGLETREVKDGPPGEEEPKQKNWLFRDEDDGPDVFITNNFQHRLR